MPKSNLHKGLAIFNLLVVSLLYSDTFIIMPAIRKEVFHTYSSTESRTNLNYSHWTNFIHTETGNKYREPTYKGYSLKYQDTFFVHITFLLRRPIKLIYPQSSPPTVINSGALNESILGKVSSIYIFLASILTFFNGLIFLNINWKERIIFAATSILLIVLFFYFY